MTELIKVAFRGRQIYVGPSNLVVDWVHIPMERALFEGTCGSQL